MSNAVATKKATLIGPALTCGFATALAVWTAWFLTHLPALGLSERVSLPILLAVWFAAAFFGGRSVPAGTGWRVGLMSGLIAAIVGLLWLGSKLAETPAGDVSSGLKPNAAFIALGFVFLGGLLGMLGGAAGGVTTPRAGAWHTDWLSRFSIVAVATVAPLLFIGGLVTSTDSGMAVPDWPNTYGSNMFLYPLGPRSRPDVYLEHTHRLFGTLVGLCALVLMVWVFMGERRTWVKGVAAAAFALVVVQGVLGGLRVQENSRFMAMIHGVLAQVTFGLIVALAVYLTPTFRQWRREGVCRCGYPLGGLAPIDGMLICPECGAGTPTSGPVFEPYPGLRRLRFVATGLLHSTILQLVFGAMYRHFRDNHSMWSHAGFAIVVLVFALLAGFAATAVPGEQGGIGPALRRIGKWTVGIVTLQFILGWATFSLGGRQQEAANAVQAILRTVHQANGALLLALAVCLFLWARRLSKLHGIATGPTPAPQQEAAA